MVLASVIPRHPRSRTRCEFCCVALQLAEVIEWIGAAQLASVDQAHEQVAYFGAVQRAIEQSVLTMQYRTLEGAFADVVVERRARIA